VAKRGFEWLEWNCSRAKRRPPPDCRAFSFVGLGCCPLAVGDWPLPPAVAVSTAAQRLRAAREAVLVTGVSRSLLLPGPPHSALLARSAPVMARPRAFSLRGKGGKEKKTLSSSAGDQGKLASNPFLLFPLVFMANWTTAGRYFTLFSLALVSLDNGMICSLFLFHLRSMLSAA